MDILIQIIGWIGAALILGAYALLSFSEKVTDKSPVYHAMNLLGATGLGVNAYYAGAWPIVALNAALALIAIESLIRKRN